MGQQSTVMMIVLLVVGLGIGAGVGYFMAPTEITTQPQQPVQPQPYYTQPPPSIEQKLDSLTTLVYGAIGASLIAALAAIVTLMQVSRRIAG